MTLAYNLNYNCTYKRASMSGRCECDSGENAQQNGSLTHLEYAFFVVCMCVLFMSLNASRYDFLLILVSAILFDVGLSQTLIQSLYCLCFFLLTTSLILSIKEADKSVFLFFIFSLKFMHWINQYNRCFAVFNSLEMNTINWIFCCKKKNRKKILTKMLRTN